MLRKTLREPAIFYKMDCQVWFYKRQFGWGWGGNGCSRKELSARQKVLADVLCLILSVQQQYCVSAHCS